MNDLNAYYSPCSPASSSRDSLSPPPPGASLLSNNNAKRLASARFIRKGKMCAWGPGYEEAEATSRVRKRLKISIDSLLPEAALEAGAPPPNDERARARAAKRRRERAEARQSLVLPHLRSPSPPLSTTRLAPLLALPRSFVDIAISPAMRHTLGEDGVEVGLMKTAGELLEGEKGLIQALGRLREVLRVGERELLQRDAAELEPPVREHTPEVQPDVEQDASLDVPSPKAVQPLDEVEMANGERASPKAEEHQPAPSAPETAEQPSELVEAPVADPSPTTAPAGDAVAPAPEAVAEAEGVVMTPAAEPQETGIPVLPTYVETDNLFRVTTDLLATFPHSQLTYTPATAPPAGPPSPGATSAPPTLTPLQKLFVSDKGLILNLTPHPQHPSFAYHPSHPAYPQVQRFHLDPAAQAKATDEAFERIAELLADCGEYAERLEEARERVADVARARKRIWGVVRRRADAEIRGGLR